MNKQTYDLEEKDPFAPLKAREQWVCWQYRNKGKKKWSKVVVDPMSLRGLRGFTTNPRCWMYYEDAEGFSKDSKQLDGYGFVATEDDPFCFLDLDDCIDPETGEIAEWTLKLVKKLASLTYLTPSGKGLRIVIEAKLRGTGGHYRWIDPDTGESHQLEVYDRKHLLTVTENVLQHKSIRPEQEFVDALVHDVGTRAVVDSFPEVELDSDLDITRTKVKRILMKYNLPPSPICEGSRKDTLLRYGAKLIHHLSEEELWEFLNKANSVLLYNKDGELEGLAKSELKEIFSKNLKLSPVRSSPKVQGEMDNLLDFLSKIRHRLRRPHDTDWKIIFSLAEHGKKYGSISGGRVRVDVSQRTLQKHASIKSRDTLNKSLKRIGSEGAVIKGKDQGDRSNHFLLDLESLMNTHFWGIEEDDDAQPYQSNGCCLSSNYIIHNIGTFVHNSSPDDLSEGDIEELEEAISSILHPTWVRGMGSAKTKYVMAFIRLGGKARAKDVADLMGIKPNSVSRTLRELKNEEIIEQPESRGPYRLTEGFEEAFYRLRHRKSEFYRDELFKEETKQERLLYEYKNNLREAAINGEKLEDVEPPPGIPEEQINKVFLRYKDQEDRYRSYGEAKAIHEGRMSVSESTTGIESRLQAFLISH